MTLPGEFGKIVLVTGDDIQTNHQMLGVHDMVSSLLKVVVAKG